MASVGTLDHHTREGGDRKIGRNAGGGGAAMVFASHHLPKPCLRAALGTKKKEEMGT